MTERFTEVLGARADLVAGRAAPLRDGTVRGDDSDRVMPGYLIQDYRFLDSFLTLLGAAIATADSFEARLHFGRFVGMASGEENTYFLRAFEALDVTEKQRAEVPDTKPTAGFKAIMRQASTTRSYAAALSSSMSPNGSISTGP